MIIQPSISSPQQLYMPPPQSSPQGYNNSPQQNNPSYRYPAANNNMNTNPRGSYSET